MSIKEYLKKHNLTLRDMGKKCGVNYSTIYRLSLPKDHKSARRISLDIALKIVKATNGVIKLEDLLDKSQEH